MGCDWIMNQGISIFIFSAVYKFLINPCPKDIQMDDKRTYLWHIPRLRVKMNGKNYSCSLFYRKSKLLLRQAKMNRIRFCKYRSYITSSYSKYASGVRVRRQSSLIGLWAHSVPPRLAELGSEHSTFSQFPPNILLQSI